MQALVINVSISDECKYKVINVSIIDQYKY